mgnify:CR=1 FL=1
MSYYSYLKSLVHNKGYCLFALIDPDIKNDKRLERMLDFIHKSNFDAILVGGSKIEDNNIIPRIDYINKHTELPIILFPGSSSQITNNISERYGGGMECHNGNINGYNLTIANNQTIIGQDGNMGGGIYIDNTASTETSLDLVNCIIYYNGENIYTNNLVYSSIIFSLSFSV